MKPIFTSLLLISLLSCNKPLKNKSSRYSSCNQLIGVCSDSNGAYCLNGYKWGEGNPLNSKGLNAEGPQLGVQHITFSFQESNGLVNTHAQIDLPSLSLISLPDCAKTQFRKAFDTWADVANIGFKELVENSEAAIKIAVADIHVSGIGFPNYPESPCDQLAGNIIIKANTKADNNCQRFYIFALHEIGHVLGLGHVSSENIMNPGVEKYNYKGLQEGDKQGITQLYGARLLF
ncbi:matrixin family metalloprotease [Reichenbachiella faecimaris]|nr:matrixin family metalloprotease [Reichenbachiella faecimaris]